MFPEEIEIVQLRQQIDKLIYHKKKLYKLGEHIDNLLRIVSSGFSNEDERTKALKKLCKINNFMERIIKDEE